MATVPYRRRWLQFSLRTLFSLFLLAAGFGSGWSAYQWRHRQELDDLQQTLKKWEGVTYIEGLGIILHEARNAPKDARKGPVLVGEKELTAGIEFFDRLRERDGGRSFARREQAARGEAPSPDSFIADDAGEEIPPEIGRYKSGGAAEAAK